MAKAEKDGLEEKVDSITFTIVSTVFGVILLCSFAIPVILGDAGLGALTAAQDAKYGGLIGVIVIVLILGLILPIVKGYNKSKR